MKTPDGKEFSGKEALKPLIAGASMALSLLGVAAIIVLRAVWKFIITTWRLAAALDSALWRGAKLLGRKMLQWLTYAAGLAASAFQSVLIWLPTRTGRAYSAISGVMLVVAGLWIIDELRASANFDAASGSSLRPPIDDEDPILARIEGRYVHLSEIEAAARAGGFLRPNETLTPQMAFDRELVESYVEQRLLAGAARNEGLHRMPSVTRRVNAARDRVLASAFMEERIDEAVTPETVERLYNAQSDVTRLGDEVRASHIVVETGEQADEILALIKGGADFAELARERSIDKSTAAYGGDLGWFTRAMMTPALSKAAFSTRTGEVAAPFQTEFGWHILKVAGRRPSGGIPFDQVKDGIEEFLRMRTIETALRDLEDEAQVVYFRPEAEEKISPPPPDLSTSVPVTEEPEETESTAGEETLR
jgi:peptidyl-prolyl cis-trans isomerase C